MIQTGWFVYDSLVILYVKIKIAVSLVKYHNMLQSNTQYGVDPYCCIPIVLTNNVKIAPTVEPLNNGHFGTSIILLL